LRDRNQILSGIDNSEQTQSNLNATLNPIWRRAATQVQ
jgi:hypothetical protein